MDHNGYTRRVDNSKVAVLMIHGIAGTPRHFDMLLPAVPQAYSVYNILLDGHGKRVEDFGSSSMKKWKAQAAEKVNELLERHQKVVIVAHSMGTLFAIQAAIDHPDRIAGLFLLAVPFCPWVRFSTAMTSLRVAWGNIRPDDKAALAMKNATSIRMDRRLWKFATWIPRLLELLAEIHRVQGVLPRLTVPTQAFQSKIDELVSARSCKVLEGHPYIRTCVLYGSGHFAYSPEDTALLQTRLKEMLTQIF